MKIENPLTASFLFYIPGICVAGYIGAKSEILELLLPLKLYAGDNQVNEEVRNAILACNLNVRFIKLPVVHNFRVFVLKETLKCSTVAFLRSLWSV